MFDETKLYRASDEALLKLAPYSTFAHWRCEGKGPAYLKIGRHVFYEGAALNAWLAAHRVPTADQPAASAAQPA